MANAQDREEIDLSSGESIGHGTYGHVYKFSDEKGAFVLKIPWRPGTALAEAFKQECEKLGKIKHSNVVTYFDVVDVNDNYGKKLGIKMEFCERGSLKELIFNPTIIYSMKDISIWAEQLFGALACIFDEHKLIHHDIKAENIFVAADFSLKLGDFGLFKESDGTRSGTFDRGTMRYASPPEIPDPSKPSETFPKLSHKNDVYSMGLVLWELVERRCTRFQRRKRAEASDILQEIKTLNQPDREINQVTPIKDPNEKRLIRPIGFNGGTNRQPIDDPLQPKPSQDARMAEGSDIMKEYHHVVRKINEEGIWKFWASTWRKRVDSFVLKFNSLNPDERSKFVRNIPNLVARALEKKIHFHEAWSYLDRLIQDVAWTDHPLEDLFQLTIEFNQRDIEEEIARNFRFYLDKNTLPLIKWCDYSALIEDLEDLGSKLRSTRFYFRAFLSTGTLQVWLLLEDEKGGVIFVRNDFQLIVRKGKWINREKSTCRVEEDDLHYLEDREIDFHQMLKKIKKQEKLLVFHVRIFLDQLVSLEESQQRTEIISVPKIGSNLPVKNYLFQLRNPPRTDCGHHPKCSILKFSGENVRVRIQSVRGPRKKPKEMAIPYYSCSSRKALQYLEEWWNFCRDYLKDNPPLSEYIAITPDSFIFIQFKCDNQYYTLLDHPNNYEDHELIYYLDERMELHKMESSKIRKLLDEIAPEMRRYAVVTPR